MTYFAAIGRLKRQLRRLTEREISVSPHRSVPQELRYDLMRASVKDWLESRLGALDRPWLVLGSAPEPTLPRAIPGDWLFVCINNAPLTAAMLGLRQPDLVIRTSAQTWDEMAGLSARTTLLITTDPLRKVRRAKPRSTEFSGGSLRTIKKRDRNLYLARALDWAGELGSEAERPSNGVLGLTVALSCGASEAIAAGISLSKQGHSYNLDGAKRFHVSTDHKALVELSKNPRVATTEKDLANDAGMRLFPVTAT